MGFAGQSEPLKCMLNGVVRSKGPAGKLYVGDQLESAADFSSLQYRLSLERGCLVNWDTQAEVWSRALSADLLNVNPADSALLLTEIPMCPTAIQDTLDEMVFEHFGFHSYCTRPAPVLAALSIAAEQAKASGSAIPPPAALVVDAGFSATHCVPIFGSSALNYAIKRLNVGGKMLTNHLKQIVSTGLGSAHCLSSKQQSHPVLSPGQMLPGTKQAPLCMVAVGVLSCLQRDGGDSLDE